MSAGDRTLEGIADTAMTVTLGRLDGSDEAWIHSSWQPIASRVVVQISEEAAASALLQAAHREAERTALEAWGTLLKTLGAAAQAAEHAAGGRTASGDEPRSTWFPRLQEEEDDG